MLSPTGKRQYLPPVRSSVAIHLAYRRRLDALIRAMGRDVQQALRKGYRENEPEIRRLARDRGIAYDAASDGACLLPSAPAIPSDGFSMDASPAGYLNALFERLRDHWLRQFDSLCIELGTWFATASQKRSDSAIQGALRKAGFTVRFTMTPAMNDAYQAVIEENVGLIRSIPAEYLTQVQGHVLRAVQHGYDLGRLTDTLEHQYGVTRRRAAFIARDQANKANAVLTRVRYQEIGIERARWKHSAGGKTPRPSHVKASRDKVIYPIAKGWFDPHVQQYIWPGELPNCRCVSQAVLE